MNKITKSSSNRLSVNNKNVLPNQITELGEMQYHVLSRCEIFFDMNHNICSCHVGATGKICKHQSAYYKYKTKNSRKL